MTLAIVSFDTFSRGHTFYGFQLSLHDTTTHFVAEDLYWGQISACGFIKHVFSGIYDCFGSPPQDTNKRCCASQQYESVGS